MPVVEPAPTPPRAASSPCTMPRKAGTGHASAPRLAGAHSLNENGQPGRKGTTPDELRAELAAIVDWLAVDKAAHLRYQPRDGLTFCNIYAHDYCHLAGVYLPRVWWTARRDRAARAGRRRSQPLIGNTIYEMRANDLFRWLRDFGPRFGWRQTGTLTKLQEEANQGAIGLIVARRKEDGRSGHIVVVVPETDDEQRQAQRRRRGDRAAAKPGRLRQLPLRHRHAELVERRAVRRERLLAACVTLGVRRPRPPPRCRQRWVFSCDGERSGTRGLGNAALGQR